MAYKKYTTDSTIRKYRSEYYRLMAEEARLNEQLHHMIKRIRKIAQDEKQSLADHIHLTNLLAQATQQKAELEAKPASKERNKQLKKAESVWKDLTIQYKRSDLRLAVLDRKKDKDNAAKYILKELKRDQVRIRAKAAYDIWKKSEQAEKYEFIDFEMFMALHIVKTQQKALVTTQTDAVAGFQGTALTQKEHSNQSIDQPITHNAFSTNIVKPTYKKISATNARSIFAAMHSRPQHVFNSLSGIYYLTRQKAFSAPYQALNKADNTLYNNSLHLITSS
ncbi:hypothetical protein QNI16_26105 [Cytophagaceae bacterium YF14B1]|uniref:Uncharacterized protein n=1 Tax=Xanthocytophaga flava TaxID=3048013 RepID=A0AAE3QR83_9BACT|nr:hypothetical protein [Xanthocytophaga flavus]MDJ1483997.1 hypothetical protein [Xanthocytophaga flavus]